MIGIKKFRINLEWTKKIERWTIFSITSFHITSISKIFSIKTIFFFSFHRDRLLYVFFQPIQLHTVQILIYFNWQPMYMVWKWSAIILARTMKKKHNRAYCAFDMHDFSFIDCGARTTAKSVCSYFKKCYLVFGFCYIYSFFYFGKQFLFHGLCPFGVIEFFCSVCVWKTKIRNRKKETCHPDVRYQLVTWLSWWTRTRHVQ